MPAWHVKVGMKGPPPHTRREIKTSFVVLPANVKPCQRSQRQFLSSVFNQTLMDSPSEFTLAEMVEMENIYKELGEESLDSEFCERLATSFSFAANRAGKPAITWKQVQSWFEDRLKKAKPRVTPSPLALNLIVDPSDNNISGDAPESSQKPKGKKVTDLSELIFEAKSTRDNAWYDVAAFLNYRVLCTGELEVRVRFSGFSNAHDEWVNVKTAVRERSIPLEHSECHTVKIGDLVLCFRDRLEQAVYCDAHVVGIQRRSHDATSCKCIFVVRYDHDNTEEAVPLERMCCRPT